MSDSSLQNQNTVNETKPARPIIGQRFRGFLPVVVDVETAGMDARTNALLEIACIPILFDENYQLVPGEAVHAHIKPFEGSKLDQRSLDFIGIDPYNPFRMAEDEKPALLRIFKSLEKTRREQGCNHCVLVGHNAHFDLGFLQAAVMRTHTKNQTPFHSFSVFDTVTLAAAAYGQTVLARACQAAGIPFSNGEAHAALYDTQKTAELFCKIVNAWPAMPSVNVDDKDIGEEEKH